MSVSTVVPLPGKDLTEAMDSTTGRHSHIFVVAIEDSAAYMDDVKNKINTCENCHNISEKFPAWNFPIHLLFYI